MLENKNEYNVYSSLGYHPLLLASYYVNKEHRQ